MATETLRPTDAFNAASWSNISNAFDADENTATTKVSETNTIISLGGTIADDPTDAWDSKANPWDSAELSVVYSKDAGVDDTAGLEYGKMIGGTYTKIADLSAETVSAVAKATFSDTLLTADFGTDFNNISNLRVRAFGSRTKGGDGVVSSIFEVFVDGEFTPGAETGFIKYWTGSVWEKKPVKVFNGATWETKPLKYFNGSIWVTVT